MILSGSSTDEYAKEKLQTEFKVRVVHTSIHGVLMTMNGVMYISSSTIKACEENPDALALIISHELAHFFLDHLPKKYLLLYS
jgi:predicted Zn-dependent protease